VPPSHASTRKPIDVASQSSLSAGDVTGPITAGRPLVLAGVLTGED
jgi:hypothetical protein